MPGRRYRKRRPMKRGTRRYARKKYMRRGRKSQYEPRLTRFTTGFPDRLIARLTYEDVYSMTSPTYHTWRMNSLYDPDYGIGGHQPRGFDQYALIYSKYRVFGFKAVIRVNNTDSTGAQIVGLIADNNPTTYTTDYLSENPRARIINVGEAQSGDSNRTIYYKAKIPHVCGLTSRQYKDNDTVAAAVTADPTQCAYLTMVTQSLNTYGGATAAMQVRVVMTFYAEFYDRKELGSS